MYHLRIKHIIVLLIERFKFGPHDTRYQRNEQQNGIAKTGYAVVCYLSSANFDQQPFICSQRCVECFCR